MDREHKRLQWKRLLKILIFLVIALIVGFFVFTWAKLNGKPVDYADLIGEYGTKTSLIEIESVRVTVYTDQSSTTYTVKDYADNVLTLVYGDQTLTLAVIDLGTIYSPDHGCYYYRRVAHATDKTD